jgi:hypothetical protein
MFMWWVSVGQGMVSAVTLESRERSLTNNNSVP